EGWHDLPPAQGSLINQQPTGWRLEWLGPGAALYADPNSFAKGVPECVHKLSNQLPPHEQLGEPGALILAGDATYKIFHGGAAFGATLSQTVAGLEPGTTAVLTVPVLVARHGDPDPYGAESYVEVNGDGEWAHSGKMGDRNWYRHKLTFTVPDNGKADIVVRVKSKWDRPKDFFIDGITLIAQTISVVPPVEPEPDPEPLPVIEPDTTGVHVRVPEGMRVIRATGDAPQTVIVVAPPGVAITILH
ncbi:MAG: hypothetical protein M9928_09180, partial [Anaerolineae bacterium]|nr:hypothetical protein [Anaerolineae bacterium]